jgi:protein-L-isoaspartate(D-aspartate) O-methyltransferase
MIGWDAKMSTHIRRGAQVVAGERPSGVVFRRAMVAGLSLMVLFGGLTMVACHPDGRQSQASQQDDWSARREAMVRQQIESRGVRDPEVLAAMRAVPRHRFVPSSYANSAYQDSPLPIGDNQTISQPYIVALMTELLEVKAGDKVLEIGTGSGYQAAVLAQMGVEVYSIEILPNLCERASATLKELHYDNVHVRCGDGYGGWPEHAPFDGIIVTAAPEKLPPPLIEQLREGAHMVIPVGPFYQDLKVITRTASGYDERSIIPVRFVPMTGEIERQPG